MKTLRWIFLGVLAIASVGAQVLTDARAESLSYGESVVAPLQDGKTWLWRVVFFQGSKTLTVYTRPPTPPKNVPILSADLSDCSFCSGDEDNCSQDGIDVLEVSQYPTPFVRVICHVGAHSQRLMIFAPQKDSQKPVFQRTGVYGISSSRTEQNLSLSYDKAGFGSRCPDTQSSVHGICQISESWPQTLK